MTRKSKREIEQELNTLTGDTDTEGLTVVIRRDRVDETGGVIGTNEQVVEL